MLFLGTTFFSGRNTIDPSPTKAKDIHNISIQNGTHDQLFVSKNPNLSVENGYDDWDFDTVLNADYDKGNPDAGNSGFSLNNTDTVVVKCREIGTMDWITIYTKDIKSIEDFDIKISDYFRPSKLEFEYMVVSVCNGVENSYMTKDIYSEFECMCVCDKDNIYGTLYDLDFMDNTTEIKSNVLELLNSEYPNIVSNNSLHYEKGTTTGSFIKLNQDNGQVVLLSGLKYRDSVKKWLNNKRPKILKFYDGRIWLISVNGSISDNGKEHNDLRQLSFDWVEIGNVNDMETLYINGLSDVGKEWWYQ